MLPKLNTPELPIAYSSYTKHETSSISCGGIIGNREILLIFVFITSLMVAYLITLLIMLYSIASSVTSYLITSVVVIYLITSFLIAYPITRFVITLIRSCMLHVLFVGQLSTDTLIFNLWTFS